MTLLSSPHSDGIDFLGTQSALSKDSFIAMDAVKWVVENVRGVYSRRQAVEILQVLCCVELVQRVNPSPFSSVLGRSNVCMGWLIPGGTLGAQTLQNITQLTYEVVILSYLGHFALKYALPTETALLAG